MSRTRVARLGRIGAVLDARVRVAAIGIAAAGAERAALERQRLEVAGIVAEHEGLPPSYVDVALARLALLDREAARAEADLRAAIARHRRLENERGGFARLLAAARRRERRLSDAHALEEAVAAVLAKRAADGWGRTGDKLPDRQA